MDLPTGVIVDCVVDYKGGVGDVDMTEHEKQVFLSACYIVRNEAENLARSIESFEGEADEIIVVDTGSTDETVDIARRCGAECIYYPWRNDFSAARNFALEHVRGEWVLFLDADEYFAEKTNGKIRELLKKSFHLEQLLLFLRNIDRDTGKVLLDTYAPRIFRNRADLRYVGRIHEELRKNGKIVPAFAIVPADMMVLMHTGYSQYVNKEKAERNLTLLLEELKDENHSELLYMYLAAAYNGVGDEEKAMFYAELDIVTGKKHAIYASGSYRILFNLLSKRPLEKERRMQAAIWAVRDFPEIPEFHAEYAECLAQHGHYRDAVEEFDRAERLIGISPEGGEPVQFSEDMRKMLKERRKLFQARAETEESEDRYFEVKPVASFKVRGNANGNIRVSACVITKDEEANLPMWLESMGEIADEIVVVDTGSKDETVRLAEAAGARVEHFNWINDFSAAKNYAISKARGDWILFLDADEYFPKEHRPLVRDAIEKYRMNPRITELVFHLVNIDKETGKDQGTSVYVSRCFRNCEWLRYEGKIHEKIMDISGRGRQVKQYVKDVVIYHTGYSDARIQNKLRRNLLFLQEKEARGEIEPLDAFYFADCHYGLGEYEKAAYYAKKTIEAGVDPVGLEERPYSILVQSLMVLKRPREELLTVFGNATERFPLDARFYMLWGISDREHGDDSAAETHFKQGFELYQSAKRENPFKASQAAIFFPTACFSLGEFAARKGSRQEAAAYIVEGLQLNKKNAVALRLLCDLLKDGPVEDIVSLLESLYDMRRDGAFLAKVLGGTKLWEIWRKK